MPKTDRPRGLRIPRFSDGSSTIHGSQIIQGTIPPAALDLEAISAQIARLKRIETIDLRLTGEAGAFLHMGNITYEGKETLHFEFAPDGGRRLVHMRGGSTPAVTLGYAPVGGQPPVRFYQDRTEIDSDVIIMSAVGRTLLQGGIIDLLAAGTTSWDAEGATGIRLKADWGIASRQAGIQNVKWDAQTGKFVVGEYGQCELTREGMIFNAEKANYQGITWKANGSTAGQFYMTYPNNPTLYLRVFGTTTDVQTRLMFGAEGENDALITLRSYASDSLPWGTPGIFLVPPSGYKVVVQGDLETQGKVSAHAGSYIAGLSVDVLEMPQTVSIRPVVGSLPGGSVVWFYNAASDECELFYAPSTDKLFRFVGEQVAV